MESDLERRSQLRSFLMYLRSRLSPADVGLPEAAHRRVPGLRRQEVAELMDVSEDWYRWFESGRPISVSSKFLARLGQVLKLDAADRVMLYRLSLPDLYRAAAEVNLNREVDALRAFRARLKDQPTAQLAVC
ncbi:MAG: helix-turn-helix domain-containing protein [Candidatus Eremiobacteraeota bacterium]|nr:helix-turn-helix domain-containing protein [Candidatus Eremiobacteraeota bacterium]